VRLIGAYLSQACIYYRSVSYRRAFLTGVHLIGMRSLQECILQACIFYRRILIGVWLIAMTFLQCSQYLFKPLSHTGRHCVGWHTVVCYGAPEWFRVVLAKEGLMHTSRICPPEVRGIFINHEGQRNLGALNQLRQGWQERPILIRLTGRD
jgi:hypothetical protein